MEIDGQIIALIIFVVIGAIQWLIKKVKGEDQYDVSEDYKELYEEYREEIIQNQTELQETRPSTDSAPPPLPEHFVPPEPISQPTPPGSVAAPAFEYQSSTSTYTAPTATELTAEQKQAVERFEQLGQKKRRHSSSSANITARTLLTTPQAARQAVILQEIFGKPRSMQEF